MAKGGGWMGTIQVVLNPSANIVVLHVILGLQVT